MSEDSYANLREILFLFSDYAQYFKKEDADILKEVVEKIIELQPG